MKKGRDLVFAKYLLNAESLCVSHHFLVPLRFFYECGN